MKKTLKPLFIALALTFGLSACNTFSGLGEDLEEAGEEITECAEGVDC